MSFDPLKIRQDFPILSRKVRGKPLIYFDNAATTQKPQPVIEAISQYYKTYNANVHRGVHSLSEEATLAMEEARAKVARFIGSKDPDTIVFTRNTTEAINLVSYTWGRRNIKTGDEILLTEMEHHSNLIPWQVLAQEVGAKLQFITVTPEGVLDLESFKAKLNSRTKILAFSAMSNVLGTVNPVKELTRQAHQNGALVLVDGATAVPHLPIQVMGWDVDFLVFSGHKMLGPTGVGVLYGKRDILESMPPFLTGGGMIQEVQLERATYAEIPTRFEAGTPDIAGVIGLGAAVEYLEELGMEGITQHESALTQRALKILGTEPEVMVYGPGEI
ncbi:MAG: SufS family cysteine desulfurase, partial [Elusimicrobia bacterium]|nr:SufS family cysteine desulfurase [Elusimicrobiota bacterium]